MNIGNLFTVSAPSGAGKTSLVKAAVERDPQLFLSISHTTRPKRPGEEDGKDYYFVTKAEFLEMVQQDKFLEHAEVFGHHYGTSRASVEQTLQQGNDVVLEIDSQGAAQVLQLRPETISVFILPPSVEVLEQRLRGRGQDSDEVIARRMAAAKSEMQRFSASDYLIINDLFAVALAELLAITISQRVLQKRQQSTHAKLISSLLM